MRRLLDRLLALFRTNPFKDEDVFIAEEKIRLAEFFKDIEGKALDDQQQTAVLSDANATLVVAGAGSGKTLTILGKVKYLTEIKEIDPKRILLLSFTTKTVAELNERLERLGLGVKATTFHKLGYDIIKKREENPPSTPNENTLNLVVNKYLSKEIINDKEALDAYINFVLNYFHEDTGEKAASLGEMMERTKAKKLIALNGEKVKSQEEFEIANYLFSQGVKYEYERKYPYGSVMYQPDFYLKDYDIYLEHFGVDKKGRAKWLSEHNEEKYIREMELKRENHKKHDTKLLETYSYYKSEGRLTSELEKMLKANKVKLKPLSGEEMHEAVKNASPHMSAKLGKLIETFINLSKSSRRTERDLELLFSTEKRSAVFMKFALPMMREYEAVLKVNNQIDFNDMINRASDIVAEDGLSQSYDYIIVDEYQDISYARFNLITAIKNINDAKLMCVGDDWQSIYRFAGSDVSLFSDFKRYVGKYRQVLIERTYRNSQDLINISSRFVQKNPKQLTKNPVSGKNIHNPVKFIPSPYGGEIEVLRQVVGDIVKNYGRNSSILILVRHSFDLEFIRRDDDLRFIKKINYETGDVQLVGFDDVDIKLMTIHKSKGLEADNVIILNLKNDVFGFPNTLADDSILTMLLGNKERYRNAEERRLFYVALTRTKNEVYLMIPPEESIFIKELRKDYEYFAEDSENDLRSVFCTWCDSGKLIVKRNARTGRDFLACSNYPYCTQTYTDINILKEPKLCLDCHSGYMIRRKSKLGEFWGCSNYPNCRGVENI